MLRIFISMFIALHGLVHLWYFTLSQGLVTFTPAMGWTGHSWLFTPMFGNAATRSLASTLYVVVAFAFVVGGVGFFAHASWARPLLIGAAILSSALILLFWEGGLSMWIEKGLIGLLINVVLLLALWLAQSPSFAV